MKKTQQTITKKRLHPGAEICTRSKGGRKTSSDPMANKENSFLRKLEGSQKVERGMATRRGYWQYGVRDCGVLVRPKNTRKWTKVSRILTTEFKRGEFWVKS